MSCLKFSKPEIPPKAWTEGKTLPVEGKRKRRITFLHIEVFKIKITL